jgi:hypothetical protein
MKSLFLVLFVISTTALLAHPGIGIVKDKKGFIYYTDLQNIYKLDPSTNKRTITVPNVHSHELYIDENDNLYGEHLWYADEATNRFDHYLWKLNANGKLDTLTGVSDAYAPGFDFSIVRDKNGNQYRVQALTTDHILKKTKDGTVEIIASGTFKDISWLQPADDGTVYFSKENAIFKITAKDSVVKIADHIASVNQHAGIYRIWHKEIAGPLYVAVAPDRVIKKINADGTTEIFYTEKESDWMPTGGLFDKGGKLWLLECNKNNDVRVIQAGSQMQTATMQSSISKYRYWLMGILFTGIIVFLFLSRRKEKNRAA